MSLDDTIAAIATAEGESGVGIIRISGFRALEIGRSVFSSKTKINNYEHGKFYYGTVIDNNGLVIDDVLFVYMKKPYSYTGENTIEIHCHGNTLVLKKTLELVINNGARTADPGEFTKRAFLNNKMDLTQAEAVNDLINAKTEAALKIARGRLEGALSKNINRIKEEIADCLSRVEAGLDFSEEEIEENTDGDILKTVNASLDKLDSLFKTFDDGRLIKEGAKTVILGRPNAGKSSLLNLLLREERAIVTEEPGTTRDTIEESISICGIGIRLIDTAGLRDALDKVESKGVELAKKKAAEAELILYMIDINEGNFVQDKKILENLNFRKKLIIIANKIDIDKNVSIKRLNKYFEGQTIVQISALTGEGIKELENVIYEKVTNRTHVINERDAGELLLSVREKDLIGQALGALKRVKTSIDTKTPGEFIALDLKIALNALGEITGETTTEDILDRIFSKFCIGK